MRPFNVCATVALLVALHASESAFAGVLAGPVVNPGNGHSYYLLTKSSWTSAESEAVTLGGHLATVRSQSENDFIFNTFASLTSGSPGDLWIGLYDPFTNDGAAHSANFQWISGEPKVYTHWGSGEPNNDPFWGGEYFAAIVVQPHGFVIARDWNDENPSGSGTGIPYGVVEVLPEPIGAPMFAAFATAILFRRRTRRSFAFPRL